MYIYSMHTCVCREREREKKKGGERRKKLTSPGQRVRLPALGSRYYFSGDGARRDADGYYWLTGRVDDVINVSGHRIGTAEVESSLVHHESCAEAAVVGVEHPIKGQGIYAYVTLMDG